MGCSYSITGTVRVRKCPEVEAILEELKSLCSDAVLDVRDEETTRHVTINIGDYFSWAGARAIDETLLKLSPFCLAAALLKTECAGERSELYLGTEEQLRQVQSLHVLNRIKREAEHLAPKELAEAIKCLQGRLQ
jgi:cobalamin-dependent methionine synthase I